jgi:hypothetical protein
MTVATVTNDATGVVIDASSPPAMLKISAESRIKLQLHYLAGRLNGVLLGDGTAFLR